MTTDPIGEIQAALLARLAEARRIVWTLCKDGRCPRMSIPADMERDEDIILDRTLEHAAAHLSTLAATVERLEAENADLRARASQLMVAHAALTTSDTGGVIAALTAERDAAVAAALAARTGRAGT